MSKGGGREGELYSDGCFLYSCILYGTLAPKILALSEVEHCERYIEGAGNMGGSTLSSSSSVGEAVFVQFPRGKAISEELLSGVKGHVRVEIERLFGGSMMKQFEVLMTAKERKAIDQNNTGSGGKYAQDNFT